MSKITLFAQIIQKLDRQKFNKLVKKYSTDKHSKGHNSWTQLISMLFCQFAKSQSVRDISNGLRSATGNLNHLGLTGSPSKSNISYQNQRRDWNLFRHYYYVLLESLGQHPDFKQVKFRIKSKIFLLDATTISLCLSLFDWARYKTAKGAVKMHTLLDFDGNLPAYVNITNGKTADNKGAYDIPLLKRSVIRSRPFLQRLLPAQCLGQQRGVFCHQAQAQHPIQGDKGERTARKPPSTCDEGRDHRTHRREHQKEIPQEVEKSGSMG